MREILFRGKRKDNSEWEYGSLVQLNTVNGIEYTIVMPENFSVEVAPETIGQYTGLKDKNGTKIFEGDIVESRASENKEDWKYWQVIFYDGSYCFEREFKKRKYKHEQNLLCENEVSLYGLVVVGNIHDNPELLEGARE